MSGDLQNIHQEHIIWEKLDWEKEWLHVKKKSHV